MPRRQVSRPRRGRQWVRDTDVITAFTVATGTQTRAPLGGFESAGINRFEAGTTVSRIKLDLVVTRTAGTTDQFPAIVGGLIVGPRSLDPEDLSPGVLGGSLQAQMKWMWWRKLYVGRDVTELQAIDTFSHYEVDVQSQRVIRSEAETLWMAFNLPVGGADTYALSYGISVLLLQP